MLFRKIEKISPCIHKQYFQNLITISLNNMSYRDKHTSFQTLFSFTLTKGIFWFELNLSWSFKRKCLCVQIFFNFGWLQPKNENTLFKSNYASQVNLYGAFKNSKHSSQKPHWPAVHVKPYLVSKQWETVIDSSLDLGGTESNLGEMWSNDGLFVFAILINFILIDLK